MITTQRLVELLNIASEKRQKRLELAGEAWPVLNYAAASTHSAEIELLQSLIWESKANDTQRRPRT